MFQLWDCLFKYRGLPARSGTGHLCKTRAASPSVRPGGAGRKTWRGPFDAPKDQHEGPDSGRILARSYGGAGARGRERGAKGPGGGASLRHWGAGGAGPLETGPRGARAGYCRACPWWRLDRWQQGAFLHQALDEDGRCRASDLYLNYPLAPETRHPEPLRALLRGLTWIKRTQSNGGAVHLIGDSAGGQSGDDAGHYGRESADFARL